jgi:cysteine-rich repeat protein
VLFLLGAIAPAVAAPNVANVTQKGSALIFPDIRVDREGADWNTLIRLQNDGSLDVTVTCYWLDGNKNRVDFSLGVTRNQPVWFDARTGHGTHQINPFPTTLANGFDNPFLLTPPSLDEATDGPGLYFKGTLVCWATDAGRQTQVKWNHLSGTATLYHPQVGAYEYDAYAFFAPTGLDQEPVGTAGILALDGVFYDTCPLYQIGQFSPAPVCGNGIIAGAETCDDGNLASGDGCSAACAVEANFACTGAPSQCVQVCFPGAPCATGEPGVCSPGTITCVNSTPICVRNVGPSAETCDGVDNNCDGNTDEGAGVAGDGNQCTADVCVAGAPSYPPLPAGSACNQNGGAVCDGAGACVASVCGDGQVTGTEECDGQPFCDASCNRIPVCGDGFIDAPETCDDGGTASGDGCSSTCTTEAAQGAACSTNEGCATGFCVDGVCCNTACTGTCQSCSVAGSVGTCSPAPLDTDPDNECAAADPNTCGTTGFCDGAGACQVYAANTPTPSQTTGDCQVNVCTGTGSTTAGPDDTDVPADDGNQCTLEVCTAGVPSHPNAPSGTSCNQNGGTVCDGSGACVSARYVFVTSTLHTGNLGGLAGADAICNTRAAAAGLPGTYMAWLSTNQPNETPATRFTQSTVPYIMVNGVKVADNWADLVDGSLDNPIDRTELNGSVPVGNTSCGGGGFPNVWTATNANGTLFNASQTCSNWMSTSGSSFWGLASASNNFWTGWCQGGTCGWTSPIYCFQQ